MVGTDLCSSSGDNRGMHTQQTLDQIATDRHRDHYVPPRYKTMVYGSTCLLPNIQFAAVPNFAEFSIIQDQQPLPLLPFLNQTYILSVIHTHTFHISNVAWECWGHQLRQWRSALSGTIASHNV